MKVYPIFFSLLLVSGIVIGQVVNPPSGGGGAPSGSAGGDLGGTYPNPTVTGAHITSGSAAFTGQSSVTSSTVTTTPTFVINDTEPSATTMLGGALYGANLANNQNLYFILGKSNTAGNAYYMRYSQLSTGNYMSFQAAGQPTQFAMFATGNSAFGNTFTDSGYKLDVLGSFRASTYNTATNCASSASPAVCSAAASGSVAVPSGANSTLVINTTAVTANSQIHLTEDQSLGTRLGITCDTTLPTASPIVTARTAGTSFTIQVPFTSTNQVCVSYTITN